MLAALNYPQHRHDPWVGAVSRLVWSGSGISTWPDASRPQINVVVNWFDELNRRVSSGKW